MKAVESQQVSWWDVHTFVSPWLEVVGSWPTAGTPEWCALPDGDPAKIAALCDAAQHHALRIEWHSRRWPRHHVTFRPPLTGRP
jgi:hypothetical protein